MDENNKQEVIIRELQQLNKTAQKVSRHVCIIKYCLLIVGAVYFALGLYVLISFLFPITRFMD